MHLTRQLPNSVAAAITELVRPYAKDVSPDEVKRQLGQPIPTVAPQWVTVAEASEESGVSTRTLRNWIRAGRITGRRRGSHWRVDVNVLRLKKAHLTA